MHILLAPNAFKGSMTAERAAQAMAEGLAVSSADVSFTLLPVADGGNGSMHLLTQGLQGEEMEVLSTNALGETIRSFYGWMEKEKKAIIGLSETSGLHLIPEEKQNVLHSNTYGLGLVIKAALERGAKELLIALGGSATVDGGSGLFRALGLRYLDEKEDEITDLPYGLIHLNRIDDCFGDKRIRKVKVTLLCDVKNPLLGSHGSAVVFAPQKGAGEEDVKILENILSVWSQKIQQLTGKDVSRLTYGGSAGGTAAGLMGLISAEPVSGISYFLDTLNFNSKLENADYVFTGEGALDSQTLEGKGPFEVARRAKERNIPVVAFSGKSSTDAESLSPYFREIITLSSPGENPEVSVKQGYQRLKKAVENWIKDRDRQNERKK